MYCIKTGCKERQKYIHIFQNSLKYSSASLSVSWKRLYNFSNCAVAIQWLACMQFIAMQANDWISNPLPNEQNADAQQTQKRVSTGFANVGVRLDAQKSVQPHSWKFFQDALPGHPCPPAGSPPVPGGHYTFYRNSSGRTLNCYLLPCFPPIPQKSIKIKVYPVPIVVPCMASLDPFQLHAQLFHQAY